jgi:O-antigen ligase
MTIAVLALGAALAALLLTVGELIVLGHRNVTGVALGPRVLARLALVFGYMALAALPLLRSRFRFLLYLAPLAALAVVFLSGTRGAAVAVPLIVLIHVAWVAIVLREPSHALLVGLLSVPVQALLFLGSPRFAGLGGILSDAVQGGQLRETSAETRRQMLEAAIVLLRERPLAGHGWGNFVEAASPRFAHLVDSGGGERLFQFHNDLANFAVAAGIPGVLAWAALLLAPVAGLLVTARDSYFAIRAYCCLQLSASYLVFGLTDLTLGYDLPTTLYAFLAAIVLGAFRQAPA